MEYAQQTFFIYGWDYVGSDENGDRLTFETEEEALKDLADFLSDPNVDQDPKDWRVVPYNHKEDRLDDL